MQGLFLASLNRGNFSACLGLIKIYLHSRPLKMASVLNIVFLEYVYMLALTFQYKHMFLVFSVNTVTGKNTMDKTRQKTGQKTYIYKE